MKQAMKQFKTIDEWRNCPMANFVCPVAIETRLETNTPRGKMFVLSLLCNGAMQLDTDVVERMYQCCLCGLCTQCGFDDTDIPAAMAAARADIGEAGMIPEEVVEFGKKIEAGYRWSHNGKTGMTLSGDAVAFITWEDQNAADFELLAKKAGIMPVVIREGEYDSALLYELGLWDASEKRLDNMVEFTKNSGVKKVVVDSPHLWDQLSKREGSDRFVPLTVFLKELVDSGKLKLRRSERIVTYHDTCRLVRRGEDETTVRGILSAAGVTLKEMRWSKKDAKCCAGPALKTLSPELSSKITRRRLDEALATGASELVVSCGHCQANFRENEAGIKVTGILDLVLSLVE